MNAYDVLIGTHNPKRRAAWPGTEQCQDPSTDHIVAVGMDPEKQEDLQDFFDGEKKRLKCGY